VPTNLSPTGDNVTQNYYIQSGNIVQFSEKLKADMGISLSNMRPNDHPQGLQPVILRAMQSHPIYPLMHQIKATKSSKTEYEMVRHHSKIPAQNMAQIYLTTEMAQIY
jgi:hypothetical protein